VADPLEFNPNMVTTWLEEHSLYSPSYLNNMRSSLASVYTITHPEETPLADQKVIRAFFQARRHQEPIRLGSTEEIWDISLITNMVKSWGSTRRLSLSRLQDKVILLLCIATMWRPRSDVGNLQFQDVKWLRDKTEKIVGVQLMARQPKETNQKTTTLSALSNNSNLCPVLSLRHFVERTARFRDALPNDHSLLLAYIDHPSLPPSQIASKTVANRVKELLTEAGVDTSIFGAHSIRSAASTAAFQKGLSINEIKIHANWSLNSDTFERHYLKTNNKLDRSRQLMDRLLLGQD
jgi:hypothetical protein